MATDMTQAQDLFIEQLNQKMDSMFSSQLDGQFSTMNVPNGLNFGIQTGPNNYYNKKIS